MFFSVSINIKFLLTNINNILFFQGRTSTLSFPTSNQPSTISQRWINLHISDRYHFIILPISQFLQIQTLPMQSSYRFFLKCLWEVIKIKIMFHYHIVSLDVVVLYIVLLYIVLSYIFTLCYCISIFWWFTGFLAAGAAALEAKLKRPKYSQYRL